ncbi:MAG: hypothetical protein M0P31_18715 [Solirubrobacteraceae bacterium]|nr:hypothetical protein [Solirubrobacteraceae bacterium]
MATKTRAFNADARRQKREDSVVTIGGREFRPTPQSTALRARMRQLSRRQEELGVEAAKLEDATSAKDRERAEAIDRESEEVMYEMVASMLVDDEGGEVNAIWLADHLAPQDTGPLIEFLSGGDDEPDPT